MDCTLAEAKAAAADGNGWLIRGVPCTITKNSSCKARRHLPLKAHADKGGDPDLSALINATADELLARRLPLRWSVQAVLEIKHTRRRETLDRLARAAQSRQSTSRLQAQMEKGDKQYVCTLIDAAHVETVRLSHRRGAR